MINLPISSKRHVISRLLGSYPHHFQTWTLPSCATDALWQQLKMDFRHPYPGPQNCFAGLESPPVKRSVLTQPLNPQYRQCFCIPPSITGMYKREFSHSIKGAQTCAVWCLYSVGEKVIKNVFYFDLLLKSNFPATKWFLAPILTWVLTPSHRIIEKRNLKE